MERAFRIYLTVLGACLLGGLAGLAGLNLAADPLGAYPRFALGKLQPHRTRITSRAAKAEMIARGDCEVLLLGTSRTQVGMPVRHPVYGTASVYNLGLNATTLTETAAVLEFSLQKNRPKRVLFGADFLLFSEVRGNSANFENSRFNPELNVLDYHCRNLLGSQTASDSWGLLRRAWAGGEPLPGERGFAPRTLPIRITQREVIAARIRGFLTDPETYGGFRYSSSRLELFRQMVRRCRRAEVELTVFIPPVHALQLETIRVAGLWSTFEQWKRDLTRILAEENTTAQVALWDFTGYTGPLIEPVPSPQDPTSRMQGYLESSHFTPWLGAAVLDRIWGTAGADGLASSFGVRLRADRIEEHLARIRSDRAAYVTAYPDEARWVEQIAASTRGQRAIQSIEF